MDNKDDKVAGGGISKGAGSAKSYKGGAPPQTTAEGNLLKELAASDPGYVYAVRNDRYSAPKEREFQFLNPKVSIKV